MQRAVPAERSRRLAPDVGVRVRRVTDILATGVLWAMASSIIVMLAAFIAYLFYLGFASLSWHFLTSPPSQDAGGGIGPEIYNSFYILILTLIFTVPIALAAGIYLQEYARPGLFRSVVQFSAESLATVPSIVMGLFGLLIFVFYLHWGFTALGGALTLTLLNLPALVRVTQEALSSVPDSLREASMGLGATKWQTIVRAVFPSAIGRLTTGIVLIAGRIFGETAALIFTAGLSVSRNHPYELNPFRSAETLAIHLWYTHSESIIPDVERVGNGSALVLLIMVLAFNIGARLVGSALTQTLHREIVVIDASPSPVETRDKLTAAGLNIYYGSFHAIKNANLKMGAKTVTALIGPSGCGKSTFLRALNRMHDLTPGARVEGSVKLDEHDIYAADADPVVIRHRIGMVFQRPNPFPKTIYENVAYGPRIHGENNRATLDAIVEKSLRQAALWDEVKDRLNRSALDMSGGQQQRMCIARVLAVEPEVILMDEPASALDPIATSKIEDLIGELKTEYTVVIVTHSMQQAARISEFTAFFHLGEIVEVGTTTNIFTRPKEKRTEDYITGRFG